MAYICKIPPYMGRMNFKKCFDNHLTVDAIKKIENNENILLPDGTQIQYLDFRDDIDDGHNFIGKYFWYFGK